MLGVHQSVGNGRLALVTGQVQAPQNRKQQQHHLQEAASTTHTIQAYLCIHELPTSNFYMPLFDHVWSLFWKSVREK